MLDLYASPVRRFGATCGLAVMIVGASVARPDAAWAQGGTFGADRNACDHGAVSQILSTSKGNLLGSAAGGALGGLLGNQIGKGSGNTLATIVGVVGGALAGGYVGRAMDPTDQACVGQALEHSPTSQTVAWQNPDNGSRYWVTPTRSYQGPNGRPCRSYVTNAVINGERQQTEGAACRGPQGWQQVSQGEQAALPPQGQGYAADGAVSPDTVFKVQQRLRELGFYVRDNIDGRWGPKTMAAVGNFQRSQNLNPTGQLDVQTLAALGLTDSNSGQPPGQGNAGNTAPTQ